MTECAAFGFLDSVEREREHWVGHTQLPFRGHTLWLFGAPGAALTSLMIGNSEQLVEPIAFEAFRRPFGINDVRAMLGRGPDLMNISNRPCQQALNCSPRLELPAQNVGVQLWLRTSGLVGGVLLIGEQVV